MLHARPETWECQAVLTADVVVTVCMLYHGRQMVTRGINPLAHGCASTDAAGCIVLMVCILEAVMQDGDLLAGLWLPRARPAGLQAPAVQGGQQTLLCMACMLTP